MREKIIDYIRMWENRCYKDGIPDELPDNLETIDRIPSYRKIAIAILKNDNSLKSLGYTPKKSIYYNILKKIEIDERNRNNPNYIPNPTQLKLF